MPKTPDYFAGKTIVITGAASGIGRATALIFAREGANVVCADINDKGASETAVEVDKKGSKALAIKVDVTKRVEVKEMAERAIATFGRVEFLFNSAGAAMRRAKFLEIDDTLMEKTFALNVNGNQLSRHASLAAAARGIDDARRCARIRDAGIRALSISPGPIRTPFQGAAQSSPELIKQFLNDVPMQRFGEPEEIGELVLFVCSDACEFMTADTVYVNGGGGWR